MDEESSESTPMTIDQPVNKRDQVANLLLGGDIVSDNNKNNKKDNDNGFTHTKVGEHSRKEKELQQEKVHGSDAVDKESGDNRGDLETENGQGNDDHEQDQPGQEAHELDESQLVSMDHIAGELEVDAKDLYEMEIPMGRGQEAISLGEMKDQYLEFKGKHERLLNVDLEESNLRASQVKAHGDLSNLMELLPQGALDERYMAEVKRQTSARAGIETQKLLEVLPDWANPISYKEAKNNMSSMVQEYGLTGKDLDNVMDHRWIIMINDLAKLKAERVQAQDDFRKVKSKALRQRGIKPKANKSQLGDKLKARAKSGDKQAQKEIIGQLFAG